VPSARGALGAASGGSGACGLGTCGAAFGAVGASGGKTGFSWLIGFGASCWWISGDECTFLGSWGALGMVEAPPCAEGANDRVKAGTGGACVGGDDPREP
jgi:hypothetical protein